MRNQSVKQQLQDIYQQLFHAYGPQHWWPADDPFEVMVGAILTQSAAWRNVEKAIVNLKAGKALSPTALRDLDLAELATLVHPSGYFNMKARKLRALAEWFGACCNDDLGKIRSMDISKLRHELLVVWGIGEETADSIILYAAEQPVFVIDAYTKRIIDRVGLQPEIGAGGSETRPYAAYQSLFMSNLLPDVKMFNEYHALLVCLGKNVCRKKPMCKECCLRDICRYSVETTTGTLDGTQAPSQPDRFPLSSPSHGRV